MRLCPGLVFQALLISSDGSDMLYAIFHNFRTAETREQSMTSL
jgi:hypothetical protein